MDLINALHADSLKEKNHPQITDQGIGDYSGVGFSR